MFFSFSIIIVFIVLRLPTYLLLQLTNRSSQTVVVGVFNRRTLILCHAAALSVISGPWTATSVFCGSGLLPASNLSDCFSGAVVLYVLQGTLSTKYTRHIKHCINGSAICTPLLSLFYTHIHFHKHE